MTAAPITHPCFTSRAIDWLASRGMPGASPHELAAWLADAWRAGGADPVLVSEAGHLRLAPVGQRTATARYNDFFPRRI